MNINDWKTVARNWRTVEQTVNKLSIVQKETRKAIQEIKEKDALVSARDFLFASKGMDEDDDLP